MKKSKKIINALMEDELGGKYGQNLPHWEQEHISI